MRTTVDLDDELLARALARFPPGTPKTVILEEGLRRLLVETRPPEALERRRDPRLQRLVEEGRLVPASREGTPPAGPGDVPLERLLADLAGDREDR